jgi:Regulator of chromosome condensation (RCC1) repeat/CARDB
MTRVLEYCRVSSARRLASALGAFALAVIAASAQIAPSVVGWGDNSYGECNPPLLPQGVVYVELAAGFDHALALRSDGKVVAWGSNSGGQATVPQLPAGLLYQDVAAGSDHSMVRRSDGAVLAFGWNNKGQCNVPSLPPGVAYVEIAGGGWHSLARRSDGAVVAWGWNDYGQCDVPVLPPGVSYVQLTAGGAHSAALCSDGSIVAWGSNLLGQCDVPVLPPGVTFVSVAAGSHTIAMRSDGRIVAWGDNYWGQCSVPVPPPGLKYVHAGGAFDQSFGLRSDGSAVVWGENLHGQCNVPKVTSGLSFGQLATGGAFALARLDPTVSLDAPVERNGLPDLEVRGIAHDYLVHPDHTCTVRFYVLVQNTGTATCGSFFVGLKSNGPEWIPPSIPTTAGKWTGLGGSSYIGPGQAKVVTVYGPGYVGPPILKGTQMQLTAYADMYDAVEESSEGDNSLDKTITIGG